MNDYDIKIAVAMNSMEIAWEMFVENNITESLPFGYNFSIDVPLEDANLIREAVSLAPEIAAKPFVSGDVFWYKGIKCICQ